MQISNFKTNNVNNYWPSINADYVKFVKENKLIFCKQCGRLQQYIPLFIEKRFIVTCFHGLRIKTCLSCQTLKTLSKDVKARTCLSCQTLKTLSKGVKKKNGFDEFICNECITNPLTEEIISGIKDASKDFKRHFQIDQDINILNESISRDKVIEILLALPQGSRIVIENYCGENGYSYHVPSLDQIECCVTNDRIYRL